MNAACDACDKYHVCQQIRFIPANLNVFIREVIVSESEVAVVIEDKPVLTTGIACIELYTFGSVEQVKNFNF